MPGPYLDSGVAADLLKQPPPDQGFPKPYSLGAVVNRELRWTYDKSVGKDIAGKSFKDVALYSRLDSLAMWLTWTYAFEPRIHEGQQVWDMECRLIQVLVDMKLEGADVDQDALHALHAELLEEIEVLRGPVLQGRRQGVRPGQSAAAREDPVRGAGAPSRKMTKGGKDGLNPKPSTDDEALEPYRNRDPLVAAYLDHKEVDKLLGTYVAPYVGEHLVKGKIHANFNAMGAETGRFSSSNQNLQNVPRPGTEKGTKIRGLFYAPGNDWLVVADYSQVEPRVYAGLSGDPHLKAPYLTEGGDDFYTVIAAPFGLDRNAGKKMFLSVAYGIGAPKLAADAGISITKARDILDNFDRQFPVAGEYKKKVIRECRRRKPPMVKTLLTPAVPAGDLLRHRRRAHARRAAGLQHGHPGWRRRHQQAGRHRDARAPARVRRAVPHAAHGARRVGHPSPG